MRMSFLEGLSALLCKFTWAQKFGKRSSLFSHRNASSTPDESYGTRKDDTLSSADSGLSPIPEKQRQLLLHGVREAYTVEDGRPVPRVEHRDEILLRIEAIGLNPIDWKSAEFGFGLPSLPCVNGRDYVGRILSKHEDQDETDVQVGDLVSVVSTDYRDYRKAAFQEYAVAWTYNTMKIPHQVSPDQVGAAGVALVTTAIALGVCLDIKFDDPRKGGRLDLLSLARSQSRELIPKDVEKEIFPEDDPFSTSSPQEDDWILIMGGSSITGQMAIQLAKLAGLRVVTVTNSEKHGSRLHALGTDLIIDRTNTEEAAKTLQEAVGGQLRYAVDTVGRETADWCQRALEQPSGYSKVTHLSPRDGSASPRSHLVGLTGLPKEGTPSVRLHTVPIKLFHTNALFGKELSSWLGNILEVGVIKLPEVEIINGGLDCVNSCLDRLRRGDVSGKRLVVRL